MNLLFDSNLLKPLWARMTSDLLYHSRRICLYQGFSLRGLTLYLCSIFQGKFYLLIEELSQLFRALVPIQLWYKYIMGEDPSSSYFLGATLIIIYSLCKVVYLISPFPCNVNADVILLCVFFNFIYLILLL